jgi:hypothetical protein
VAPTGGADGWRAGVARPAQRLLSPCGVTQLVPVRLGVSTRDTPQQVSNPALREHAAGVIDAVRMIDAVCVIHA